MKTNVRVLLTALLAALALVAAACGDDEEETATTEPAAAETQPAEPTDTGGSTEDQATGSGDGEISANLDEKPAIAKPSGEPPSELETEDVVQGEGRTAKAGDNVTVQYVGVNFSNGEEFDASWNSGQPFTFTLGAGQVIAGWDEGVAGMKEGGRRKLVIPPDMGYGPAGSPPAIGPNETLVFVVDVVKVEPGSS